MSSCSPKGPYICSCLPSQGEQQSLARPSVPRAATDLVTDSQSAPRLSRVQHDLLSSILGSALHLYVKVCHPDCRLVQ